jgi:putative phosphoribosyl transferase
MAFFKDRADAGRQLAEALLSLRNQNVVVLGLPRGGVPVASHVAQALGAPLDVIVVRKLGAPDQPELAVGAIGEGDIQVMNPQLMEAIGCDPKDITAVERRERDVLNNRVQQYRHGRPPIPLDGRIALIVDDGLATGATARVACRIAHKLGASSVILAVPVAPANAATEIVEADHVVVLHTLEQFFAVGMHYEDFSQTSDEEVIRLLDDAAKRMESAPSEGEIPAGEATLHGTLTLPPGAHGVVIFAHGSGSSRHSPRNTFVARILNDSGLGTLLIDLLTPEEEPERINVFDIDLLANRLIAATRWLRKQPATAACKVGFFGASTGAGAALVAAADPSLNIAAVVSRGGRPDLAQEALSQVTAPTLLIVGSHDHQVLELNRWARERLSGVTSLEIVDGASHLFEEPGTLEKVADLARYWFDAYLNTDKDTDKDTHEAPHER